MAKSRSLLRCTECGATSHQWSGRCGRCDAWNSLVEAPTSALRAPVAGAIPLVAVEPGGGHPAPTGVDELDRVLGGGLVGGSVALLGGEPGIGKSTLLLQVLGATAHSGRPALLITAEESADQIARRADRLGVDHPDLLILADTRVSSALAAIAEVQPAVAVIDSIQTVAVEGASGVPGSVTQVREAAQAFVGAAKSSGTAVVLAGHVTKDGTLAGPRMLEHLVDTVLELEGDRHHALRLLRAVKHRYGPTGEVGVFEMTSHGMVGLADPSKLLLGDRLGGITGSIVVPTMSGRRPLLVEVQALVAPSPLPTPRRSAQGLDSGRLALILAVLSQRCGIRTAGADVWASATGGVRVTEPGADLAMALAVASAATNAPIPEGLVACGEIGLGGEIRQAPHTEQRLAEAARLGLAIAVVPPSAPPGPPGLELVRPATLGEAVELLGVNGSRPIAGAP